MKNKNKIICIGGPTASGKSEIAIKIAKHFNGEIISADCVQIYKHLNIGSAKVTKDQMQGINHHLIDILEPNQTFSAHDFKIKAEEKILEITNKGKLPIIVGGTGFYIKSLLFPNTISIPDINKDNYKKYEKLLQEKGKNWLFDYLKKVDPETANKLHKNDTMRVIRALEIFETTGKIKSEFETDFQSPYNFKLIGIYEERKKLYDKINKRVDLMESQGLFNEVENLKIKYNLTSKDQSMKAIGYNEVLQYINNKNLTKTETLNLIKRNTRRYAKRQFTWFKKMPKIAWFKPGEDEKLFNEIQNFLKL